MTMVLGSADQASKAVPSFESPFAKAVWLAVSVRPSCRRAAEAPTVEETGPEDHPSRPDSVCGVASSSVDPLPRISLNSTSRRLPC